MGQECGGVGLCGVDEVLGGGDLFGLVALQYWRSALRLVRTQVWIRPISLP